MGLRGWELSDWARPEGGRDRLLRGGFQGSKPDSQLGVTAAAGASPSAPGLVPTGASPPRPLQLVQ